jgi:hypothetical protein
MILLVIVLSVIYLLVTLYIVSTFIIFCVIRGGPFLDTVLGAIILLLFWPITYLYKNILI